MTKERSKANPATVETPAANTTGSYAAVEYQFPPIKPKDRHHEAAHDFMCHFKMLPEDFCGDLLDDRAAMLDEVQYWLEREQASSEDHDDEDGSNGPFSFMDFGVPEVQIITDIVMVTLKGRKPEELWLYDYAETDRLSVEAHMEKTIEEKILNGDTEHIWPHAIEAGIERLKRKGLMV